MKIVYVLYKIENDRQDLIGIYSNKKALIQDACFHLKEEFNSASYSRIIRLLVGKDDFKLPKYDSKIRIITDYVRTKCKEGFNVF